MLNNLADGRTQDAWDLFLGRFIPRKPDAADAKKQQQPQQGAAAGGARGGHASPAASHLAGPSPVGVGAPR